MIQVKTTVEGDMKWKHAMDNIIQNNTDLKFIGVYSMDSFDAVCVAGSDSIIISTHEVKAIVTHIKSQDNSVTRVKISGLFFACMSFGTDRMTGMSNFNLDEKSRSDADQILFRIAEIRYTRQASFEAKHMLTISAIIHEDVILIGIAVSSETMSVLKLIQYVITHKDDKLPSKKSMKHSIPKPLATTKASNRDTDGTIPVEDIGIIRTSTNDLSAVDADKNDHLMEFKDQLEPPVDIDKPMECPTEPNPSDSFELQDIGFSEVKRRTSTKAEIDRRKDSTRRETEFCEDWRTATIRSIEALRNIGPFDSGAPFDDDQKPLIETESGSQSSGQRESAAALRDEKGRRASRPTMV